MKWIEKIRKNVVNISGWHTGHKYCVIESDDWGTISMPSAKVYNHLLAKGIPVDQSPFSRYDTMENAGDLTALFEVLSAVKDVDGNHPVITADTIVANPDFEKIKASNFQQYFFEPFTETYRRNSHLGNLKELWEEGMNRRLIWPQLHGREHLNPREWLKGLLAHDAREMLLFDTQTLFASTKQITSKRKMGYLAAFDYESIEELQSFNKVIDDAVHIFINAFSFKPVSFVAPTGIRSDQMDPYLVENGILYHQLAQQILPMAEGYKKRDRWWGAVNSYGQIYWRRNAKFEPSVKPNFPWVQSVLQDADIVFRW